MKTKTLVLGSGKWAARAAQALLESGLSVTLAALNETGEDFSPPAFPAVGGCDLEVIEGAKIRSCTGSAGRFTMELTVGDRRIRREVQHILIAEDSIRRADGPSCSLEEGPFVMSLSDFKALLDSGPGNPSLPKSLKRVAFLNGVFHESNPVIAQEVMQAALSLQKNLNVQAYVFTGNLKVAGEGLEALCRNAKEAGVIFVKTTDSRPNVSQAKDGSVSLMFTEEALRQPCLLEPDITVLDETFLPSPNLETLAELLKLEKGPDGFLQADNVHRLPASTNRKGIWVVGPARAVSAPSLVHGEIAHTALAMGTWRETDAGKQEKAHIEAGLCIQCLTCFRLCPYRAVELSPRPEIAGAACEGCGICVAECPRQAIGLPILPTAGMPLQVADKIRASEDPVRPSDFVPELTVFACTRSAIPASKTASATEGKLPGNLTLVEVPCAGAVSLSHLLEALKSGADGVLLFGCHPDNCHSDRGTVLARRRLERLQAHLPTFGLPAERLAFRSLAANMGTEFLQMLDDLIRTLKPLGPNPLKVRKKDGA